MNDWIGIENKFKGKCYTCGNMIEVGENVFWKKGSGIRHNPECETHIQSLEPDNSALIIIDDPLG